MAQKKKRTSRISKQQKERAQEVIKRLKKEFPDARCALDHQNAFELLVATILSAQCTDKKVNQISPQLFKAFPKPEAFAKASVQQIEKQIRSIGLYRSKAKNISAMSKDILNKYNGEVPDSLEELISLAGVGRKTANVVLGVVFNKAEGVVVDTHVRRISKLLGLTKNDHPEKIEQDLIKLLPQEEWTIFSHLLILHGRRTCIARRPQCETCVLLDICPRIGLSKQKKTNRN